MKHTKESKEWLQIRANAGHWFSPDTLRFFGSRIYWHTLTRKEGYWLFITAEDTHIVGEKRFSIRLVDSSYDIHTIGEFLAYDTLAQAKTALKSYLLEKVGA